MEYIVGSLEFFHHLHHAVNRYIEIKEICTKSGCACPCCSHIMVAHGAIGDVVLQCLGLIEIRYEAPLPPKI